MKNLILFTAFLCLSVSASSQDDDCDGATGNELFINATCTTTSFNISENGQPEAGITNSSCGTGTSSSDEWFSFTGDGNSVEIAISGTNRNGTVSIWSTCTGTTPSGELACLFFNAGVNSSMIFATTNGVTYYVQIQRWSGGTNKNLTGDICITSVSGSAPVNDDCANAIGLTVGTSCTVLSTTNLNATNSSPADPSCADYQGGDVWFSFVAPASGSVSIESFGNSLYDGGMALYSGTCGALTELLCDDDGGSGLMPAISSGSLNPGDTYFVRFWEYGNDENGTFDICVTAGSVATGNQDCISATQVCNNSSFSGNSNGYATQELNASNQGCLSTEHQSSWYYFQAVASGTVEFTISPNTGVDYDFALWGPNIGCSGLNAPARCSFASGISTDIETGSYDTGLSITSPATGNSISTSDGDIGDDLDGWVTALTVNAGETYILLIDNFSADNTAFNLNWTFSSPDLLNCVPTPLPVVFQEFVGNNFNGRNALNWKTAIEINNDYFTIERSTDNKSWVPIHTQNGAINSQQEQHYSYIDRQYTPGTDNYYRLSQTDLDGKSSVLSTLVINNREEARNLVKIVNPAGQEIDENTKGIQIYLYSDGSSEKVIKY